MPSAHEGLDIQQLKVLLIEGNPESAQLIREALAEAGTAVFDFEWAEQLSIGLERLAQKGADVLLLDLSLPDGSGLETFMKAHAQAPEVPIVVLSDLDDEALAIQAVQEGAQDYLVNGQLEGNQLRRSIRYAIERQRALAQLEQNTRQQLELSIASFRNLVESNVDGMAVVDRKGIVRFANPALECLLGRQAEGLLCEPFGFPLAVGETTEVQITGPDHSARVAEMRVVETVWEGEHVFLASLRDVTGRKEAEEQLKLRAQLLDAATDSILLHDFEGNIAYFNEAAYKSHGYSQEEFRTINVYDLVAPKHAKLVRARTRELMEKGEVSFESTHIRKNRSIIPVEVRARVIEWGGKRFILNAIRDIIKSKLAQEEVRRSLRRLQRVLEGTVQAMASMVEIRDPFTAGHERRVAQLACAIAREMNLAEERVEGIRIAALLHDLGKIAIPAEILSKPGLLGEPEFGLIKAHPRVGYIILKPIDFPWPIAKTVLQHHERMDGSGYPQGSVSGEDLILEARILAVADVVEAMASHRPYRPALGIDKALEEVSRNSGILYDPEVAEKCLMLFQRKGFAFDQTPIL